MAQKNPWRVLNRKLEYFLKKDHAPFKVFDFLLCALTAITNSYLLFSQSFFSLCYVEDLSVHVLAGRRGRRGANFNDRKKAWSFLNILVHGLEPLCSNFSSRIFATTFVLS
jgi:hypothetical protein